MKVNEILHDFTSHVGVAGGRGLHSQLILGEPSITSNFSVPSIKKKATVLLLVLVLRFVMTRTKLFALEIKVLSGDRPRSCSQQQPVRQERCFSVKNKTRSSVFCDAKIVLSPQKTMPEV